MLLMSMVCNHASIELMTHHLSMFVDVSKSEQKSLIFKETMFDWNESIFVKTKLKFNFNFNVIGVNSFIRKILVLLCKK